MDSYVLVMFGTTMQSPLGTFGMGIPLMHNFGSLLCGNSVNIHDCRMFGIETLVQMICVEVTLWGAHVLGTFVQCCCCVCTLDGLELYFCLVHTLVWVHGLLELLS